MDQVLEDVKDFLLGDNHAVVAISKTTLLSVRNECMAK
jgi:hypothetical protein